MNYEMGIALAKSFAMALGILTGIYLWITSG